jgi:D-serine deaminase-like pyridoxal phosphate-dependent protein
MVTNINLINHIHMKLTDIVTPAALIDLPRMQNNIERMQAQINSLGARFRPHVKTSKCIEVTRAQVDAGAQGITVSTLKEAEQFFAAGISDITYAVGIVPSKLKQAHALMTKGCDLKILTDSVASAKAISEYGVANGLSFKVLIEIDTDDHRSGIKPESQLLLDVAAALVAPGAKIAGVLTHAGSSYDLNTPDALIAMAEQERALCVRAATRLRDADFSCETVSVGSTPTALSALNLNGVTEVRAGVYVFFDLVMHNVGVCAMDEVALSVLTTVIGHQEEKGWAIIDAGWMAMSRDRGTQKQTTDFGYGQVCQVDGSPIAGFYVTGANQEHGIISSHAPLTKSISQMFPIGMQLRILPNHACATGAQFPQYQALDATGHVQTWDRFYGW